MKRWAWIPWKQRQKKGRSTERTHGSGWQPFGYMFPICLLNKVSKWRHSIPRVLYCLTGFFQDTCLFHVNFSEETFFLRNDNMSVGSILSSN